MARRMLVVWGALACLFGCGEKQREASGDLGDVAGGGQGGSSIMLFTGGTASGGSSTVLSRGGGSGVTSSTTTCLLSEVACNGGCLSASLPTLGNCQLLVPEDLKRGAFTAMTLDQGELFVSAGNSIYRVDTTSGALGTITTVTGTYTHDIIANGDSIYFVDEANGADLRVMKAPRAGGTATALTGVVSSSGRSFPLSVSGGYLVFQSGSNTLQCVPLAGGDATKQSSGIHYYDAYAAAPGGAVFYTMTSGRDTTIYRGVVPFPFAVEAVPIGTLSSSIFKLHAEDDYLYAFEDHVYQRIPAAGGNVETLAAISDASGSFDAHYLSATEVIYVTETGLSSVSAAGGLPTVIGQLRPSAVLQIVADADFVYALAWGSVVRFSRH